MMGKPVVHDSNGPAWRGVGYYGPSRTLWVRLALLGLKARIAIAKGSAFLSVSPVEYIGSMRMTNLRLFNLCIFSASPIFNFS